MKKLLFILLLSLPLLAGNLQLKSGSIAAHTEMLMDTEIDPLNSNLFAQMKIQDNDFTTLSGKFWVDLNSFASDNTDRDEHMYESLDTENFKLATYTIISVTKSDALDMFKVKGTLDFHGHKKELNADAKITLNNGALEFNATSMMMMPEYGVEMPCMMFLCVRDQLDLVIKASFTH